MPWTCYVDIAKERGVVAKAEYVLDHKDFGKTSILSTSGRFLGLSRGVEDEKDYVEGRHHRFSHLDIAKDRSSSR